MKKGQNKMTNFNDYEIERGKNGNLTKLDFPHERGKYENLRSARVSG